MRLTVHLHTILQRETPSGRVNRLELELPAGSTVADLLRRLDVPLEPEHLLLVVNGRITDPTHRLMDGDSVNLMPALSGG